MLKHQRPGSELMKLMHNLIRLLTVAVFLYGAAAHADQIVQEGSLEGGLGTEMHDIFIDQFDEMSGTNQLNFVQLDFLTSLIGGGQSNGSGVPTHIFAQLSADYFLDNIVLAETEALIDTIITNTGSPGSFTVFNSDTEQVIFDQPAELAPWIGSDQILITAVTEFALDEDPPGSVGFSAGGTVNYSVIYDFTVIPEPSALTLLVGIVAFALRRSRTDLI
jgi:hypothetical protein